MAEKASQNGGAAGKGFPIIGIGASAGGLEALQRFLSVLPKDFGFALVFVQHLSAKYKSILAELLSAKKPSLVIQEISAGLKIQPGRLYLSPPGKEVRLRNALFQTTVHPEGLIHLPIDEFLSSLADDAAERAIAVIFSGAGTDGARGTRAVREAGGTVYVQDPQTAEFSSMPLAAIAAGQADAVLSPEDICRELLKVQGIGTAAVSREPVVTPEDYDAFFRVLFDKTGGRFNHYKKSVVGRRIRRRMYLHGFSTVRDYLDLVSSRETEAASLASDLMIGVTSFFRDRTAWKALNIEVVKKLAAEDTHLPVRVWTPASATGEEAYSITMMLSHELDRAGKTREIQVFATDVNDRALEKAREGKYPASITADVPKEYIQKYFTSVEDGQALVVTKEIRERVVVARQDLLTDPPFSKLDLIICRNFMIYLEPEAQEKCIVLFHYALKDGGYLFLGNAETAGKKNSLFTIVGRKQCRVYQKVDAKPATRLPLSVPYAAERTAQTPAPRVTATERQSATSFAQEHLLEEFAPAAVAIDQNFEIVYHNGRTNRYLRQPRGVPTQNLLDLLPDTLRNRIRGAVYRAGQEGKSVSIRANVSGDDDRKRPVALRISKIKENLFVVVFQEKRDRAKAEAAVPLDMQRIEETAIHQLESELSATRQDLQSHIEQLKSLNEELQSSNEELQASNEELETSREELQSLNEELVTVNSQLQTKIEEQDETNNDLNNFLASTNIPTIFLDEHFRVRRYTPAMLRLIKLLPSDVGRPIVDMSQENLGPDLIADAESVLESLVPVKQEVRMNGTWFVRATLPYRTADSRIAGVVVTYNDVTDLKTAEERTRHLASFPQFNPSPVLEVNSSGSITYSNAATQKVLESIGLSKNDASEFLPHDIDGILRDLEKNIEATFTREVEVGERVFGETLYVAPQFSTVRIYAFDVTERRRAEHVMMARLRLAEASYKGALSADAVLRLTLDELEVQTGSRIGFFHFLEKDQETLSLQSWSTNTVATMCSAEGKGRHYNISQAGVWVDCVREKRPVIHNDYSSLPHKKGMPEGHAPVTREMVVPIFRGGMIVAIIGVGNKEMDYTESDIEIATYLGDFSWEIVERKRVEEALRESEERLGLFIAHAPASLAMFDRDMRYLSFSRRWMSDYGLGDRDLRGLSHYDVFPEIPEEWKAIHRRALAGEVVRNDHDRFDRADGSVQWLRWEVRPWYNAAGAVAGIVVFSEDITERKRAEALIGRLAAIVESADDAIISKDLNGVIQSWNIGAENIFGYTAEEAVGRNISFLVPPDHADETPDIIERILKGEHIEHFESARMRKDGTIIPVSLTYSAIRDASGKVIGVSKVAHDIMGRKKAEEALRLSEERFRFVLAHSSVTMATLDRDLCYTWVYNPASHLKPEDVVGKTVGFAAQSEDQEKIVGWLRNVIATGESGQREIELLTTDGTKIFETHAEPIHDAHGEILGAALVSVDVTERKRAEEEIRQRVEELRQANEELARFNRAAVGRELRMVELKQEINELSVKAGEPPRYPLEFEK